MNGDKEFDYIDFWKRSLTVSVAGRMLAIRSGNSDLADEAFLCGMLSHIGGSILARGMPEDYHELIIQSPGNWPSSEAEEKHYGFCQSDVLLALLESWSLPCRTVSAVGYMQRPAHLPKGLETETRELTAIMALAALSGRVLCDTNRATPYHTLLKWAGARYGLGHLDLDALLNELGSGVNEMAGLIQIELPPGRSSSALVQAAREQLLARSISSAVDLSEAKRSQDALRAEKEKLKLQASTDVLTNLPNRAALNQRLDEEIRRRLGRRMPEELGLLMLDVDNFKLFNDTWGHAAGDAVLTGLGDVLSEVLRPGDFAARYGGEEFTVIMPLANEKSMTATAERIRFAVEEARIPWDGQILRITISIGGAKMATVRSDLDGQRLLETADAKLYEAKEAGRNCFRA